MWRHFFPKQAKDEAPANNLPVLRNPSLEKLNVWLQAKTRLVSVQYLKVGLLVTLGLGWAACLLLVAGLVFNHPSPENKMDHIQMPLLVRPHMPYGSTQDNPATNSRMNKNHFKNSKDDTGIDTSRTAHP
jgi:hypothetical protein